MSDPVRPDLDAIRERHEIASTWRLTTAGDHLALHDVPALIAWGEALEAQLATTRQRERARCARLLAETSARWFAEGDDEMGEELAYLARAMAALPDRELSC